MIITLSCVCVRVCVRAVCACVYACACVCVCGLWQTGIPEETMRRQQLANVLDMLPEQNQILTKYLISFLVRVSSYASDNLMTAANLATVRLSRSLSFYLFVFFL